MSHCPCCSNVLLRHIQGNKYYWFCRNCWEVMPAFNEHEYVSSITTQQTLDMKYTTTGKEQEWELYSAG